MPLVVIGSIGIADAMLRQSLADVASRQVMAW
jgi:hypothetical protein